MRGCKRNFIQSYLDEFIWRFNKNVNNDRVKCYYLILNVIAKYYQPGTTHEDFEKICIEAIGDDDDQDAIVHEAEDDEDEEDCDETGSTVSDVESLLGSLIGSNKSDVDVDDEQAVEE